MINVSELWYFLEQFTAKYLYAVKFYANERKYFLQRYEK